MSPHCTKLPASGNSKLGLEASFGRRTFPAPCHANGATGVGVGTLHNGLRVRTRSSVPDTIRYGLTNVRPPRRPHLALCLGSGDTSIDARLLRIPDCELIFDRVKVLRDTEVTCELEISTQGQLATEETQRVASDVCYLLSIAQGCKVEWIYCDEYDREGLICRAHWMRHTRPFGGLEVVRTHPIRGIREFLEMTYPTYMRRRDAWSLTSGPIDQYLEAKADEGSRNH